MRRLARTLLLVLTPLAAAAEPEAGERMAAWLGTLDAGQRQEALYAFDDDERFDLRLAPFGLEGLPGEELDDTQWRGLMDVLGTVLSPAGLHKVETITSLEREVRLRDRAGWLSWPFQYMRKERRYFLALFGEPGAAATWGLRFDGHHVSLNWTLVPGEPASVTPLFFGSEPREVPPEMERAGLRALPEEEDRARALWNALDAEQQGRAALPLELSTGPFGVGRPMFVGEGERVSPGEPAGLPAAEMTPAQRALLQALLEVYLGNFNAEVAAARRAQIDARPDTIHFAWAGGEHAGEPGYYRLQGPAFLIEFDNTVKAADHVHVVWREPGGDFGRDLLAEHHARAHGADGQ